MSTEYYRSKRGHQKLDRTAHSGKREVSADEEPQAGDGKED